MKFPKFIDLEYLSYIVCYCCCREKSDRISKLRSLASSTSDEITTELDIVRLVRRLRSYGIALYYLTNQQQKTLISRMAAYKPLRNDISQQ